MIDSGVSKHATLRYDFFTSYIVGDFGSVKIEMNYVIKVIGCGDMVLETNNGFRLIFKNVKYIPSIRVNIISIRKLDDEGYYNFFGNGRCKLTIGHMVVARGKIQSKYVITC